MCGGACSSCLSLAALLPSPTPVFVFVVPLFSHIRTPLTFFHSFFLSSFLAFFLSKNLLTLMHQVGNYEWLVALALNTGVEALARDWVTMSCTCARIHARTCTHIHAHAHAHIRRMGEGKRCAHMWCCKPGSCVWSAPSLSVYMIFMYVRATRNTIPIHMCNMTWTSPCVCHVVQNLVLF